MFSAFFFQKMDFLPDFWRENLNILMVFKIIKKSENIFRRENSNF